MQQSSLQKSSLQSLRARLAILTAIGLCFDQWRWHHNRSVVDLPDSNVRLIGCTLWSEVGAEDAQAVEGGLSDYRAIKIAQVRQADHASASAAGGVDASSGGAMIRRTCTVADTNAWHARELRWLEAQLEAAAVASRRVVVLSHHAPTFHGACAPEHNGSPIAAAFCTALERLFRCGKASKPNWVFLRNNSCAPAHGERSTSWQHRWIIVMTIMMRCDDLDAAVRRSKHGCLATPTSARGKVLKCSRRRPTLQSSAAAAAAAAVRSAMVRRCIRFDQHFRVAAQRTPGRMRSSWRRRRRGAGMASRCWWRAIS
eukprot:SAG11_NODE_157_length_14147_cov_8.545202_10_plen_313_part_00